MHICFLDIDGTLLRTGGAGLSAFAATLADEFGITEMNGDVGFAGRSDKAIALDLLRHHGLDASEANWQRFCTGYLPRLEIALATHKGAVLPGVRPLLDGLASRGDIALGLLTGNMREGARRKLSHYGLWERFPFGGFGDEHMERCDIAAAALSAAESHLGQQPNTPSSCNANDRRILVIGDTPHDIRCGRSIGALCVAVPTGMSTRQQLREARPDVIVETLEDLDPILRLLGD